MASVPPRCGICPHYTYLHHEGSTLPQCGHRSGYDADGQPGLLIHNQVPPDWCPLRNGWAASTYRRLAMFFRGGGALQKGEEQKEEDPERVQLREENEKLRKELEASRLQETPTLPEFASSSQPVQESEKSDVKSE